LDWHLISYATEPHIAMFWPPCSLNQSVAVLFAQSYSANISTVKNSKNVVQQRLSVLQQAYKTSKIFTFKSI